LRIPHAGCANGLNKKRKKEKMEEEGKKRNNLFCRNASEE
jgi:hypothetical protein